MLTGNFPRTFKVAHVTPILKKPKLDCEDLKNFRPISNLKFLSKLTERVAASQLNHYIQHNNLHSEFQSAYRKHHSIETALLRVHNDLAIAIDAHYDAVLILLDLSAAFDTLDHSILLNRLCQRYGFTGDAFSWLKSYLQQRSQVVTIGTAKSQDCELEWSVPQGSVLGPILFTLYTGPLGDIVKAHGLKHMVYADDTQIYLLLKPGDHEFQLPRVE